MKNRYCIVYWGKWSTLINLLLYSLKMEGTLQTFKKEAVEGVVAAILYTNSVREYSCITPVMFYYVSII